MNDTITGGRTSRWGYASIILGAALGMFAGYAPLFNGTAGVFMRPVAAEFHWGRSEVALSFAASMLGLALVSPLVGRWMDRHGVRRVILASAVLFSLATMGMALQPGNLALWIVLSAIVGMAGAATSVLGYLSIMPQWFDRRLGLATGLSMCGLGVGAVVLPAVAQYIVTQHGWRAAYAVMGGSALLLAVAAYLLLRERQPASGPRDAADADGMPFSQACRSYRLWAIWLAIMLASAATLSINPHLPAMMVDKGFTPGAAARMASMVGLGLLLGRLLTGLLLDRIHAPYVAAVFFAAGMCGLLLLRGSHDYSVLLPAAVLVGLTIGAEGDLIAYLIRAYFGRRSFGALFGIAFSGYGIGAVVGPVCMGLYYDAHRKYDLPLLVMPCMLLAGAALLLSLGTYQRLGRKDESA